MRIATWNVERLKHKNQLDLIHEACIAAEADILVLTETDERVVPAYPFCYRSTSLKGVSKSFMSGHRVAGINEWNYDKALSDHRGIVVQID